MKPKSRLETAGFFSKTSEAFQRSYSTDPDFQERRNLWSNMIAKYSADKKIALDLGCGPGILTRELQGTALAVTAVDGSKEMLELCRKNSFVPEKREAEFLHDYLPALSKLKNRSFDFLLCSSVLEYVEELQSSLNRISQLLAPGGIAILSMPNRSSIYRKFETAKFFLTGQPAYRSYVKHMLTQEELAKMAKPTGLEMREFHFYGNGSGLVARASSFLPHSMRKNLFLSVFEKKK